jgi:hypothetical protein
MIALGGIHILQSSVYIETLARMACTVYPFDWPPTTINRWTFILVSVRLGHNNMEQHLGSQNLARLSLIDQTWVFPAISFHVSPHVI